MSAPTCLDSRTRRSWPACSLHTFHNYDIHHPTLSPLPSASGHIIMDGNPTERHSRSLDGTPDRHQAQTPPTTANDHLTYPSASTSEEAPPPPPATAQPKVLLKDRLYVGNLHPTVDEYVSRYSTPHFHFLTDYLSFLVISSLCLCLCLCL